MDIVKKKRYIKISIMVLLVLIFILTTLILYFYLQEYWNMYLPNRKMGNIEITSSHNSKQHIKEATHIGQGNDGVYFTEENKLMYMSENGKDIKEIYSHNNYIEKIVVLDNEIFIISLGRIYRYSAGKATQIIENISFNNYFVEGKEICCLGFDNDIKKYNFNGKLISEVAAPFRTPPLYYDYVLGQDILYNEEDSIGFLVPYYYRFNKNIIRYTYNKLGFESKYSIPDDTIKTLEEKAEKYNIGDSIKDYKLEKVKISKVNKYREYGGFLYVKARPELDYVKHSSETSDKIIYNEKLNFLIKVDTSKCYENLGGNINYDIVYLGENDYSITDFQINNGYVYVLEENNNEETKISKQKKYCISKINLKDNTKETMCTKDVDGISEVKIEVTDNWVFLCEYRLSRPFRIYKMNKNGNDVSLVLDLGKETDNIKVN